MCLLRCHALTVRTALSCCTLSCLHITAAVLQAVVMAKIREDLKFQFPEAEPYVVAEVVDTLMRSAMR
jgi:hypothetical protein